MNKTGNIILKLLGDRVLFIVASFIFLFPLTAMMTLLFPWPNETQISVYTLFTMIPYLSLVYTDMWLYGKWEHHEPNVKRTVLKVAINEIGTIVFLLWMLLAAGGSAGMALLSKIIYSIWTGPFSAGQVLMLLGIKEYTLPVFCLIAPLTAEILVAFWGYYLGLKGLIPMNIVRKKLGLRLIDRK